MTVATPSTCAALANRLIMTSGEGIARASGLSTKPSRISALALFQNSAAPSRRAASKRFKL
jgi:hypothetical protein